MILQRLKERGVNMADASVTYDEVTGTAHFMLYNLSGQLVGYQRWNPALPKQAGNQGRYFTHVTEEGRKKKLAVWGLHTVQKTDNVLFVVEGIFDAVRIHNAGYPAIACLQNNPKAMKPWLSTLSQKIIVVHDNDKAGITLAKFGDIAVTVPDEFNDLGDMQQETATRFIKEIVSENIL